MFANYFRQKKADPNDMHLKDAIDKHYVPRTCLLAGSVVLSERSQGRDPCKMCNGPRDICKGRKKESIF